MIALGTRGVKVFPTNPWPVTGSGVQSTEGMLFWASTQNRSDSKPSCQRNVMRLGFGCRRQFIHASLNVFKGGSHLIRLGSQHTQFIGRIHAFGCIVLRGASHGEFARPAEASSVSATSAPTESLSAVTRFKPCASTRAVSASTARHGASAHGSCAIESRHFCHLLSLNGAVPAPPPSPAASRSQFEMSSLNTKHFSQNQALGDRLSGFHENSAESLPRDIHSLCCRFLAETFIVAQADSLETLKGEKDFSPSF
jgi:hypothetical protein